jgi:tryptophan halogenase
LPVDSFLSFTEEHVEDKIMPCTEVIAMKYGWISKIPLQSSVKCSYFYDSSMTDLHSAIKEVEEMIGNKINVQSSSSFSQGYCTKPWQGNKIRVGMSACALEPLDGSNLWASSLSIMDIMSDTYKLVSRDARIAEEYNERHVDRVNQVASFTYMHYIGEKNDTDFWKKFKDTDKAPKDVKTFLSRSEYRLPEYSDFFGKMYALEDWIQVFSGLRLTNIDMYKRACEANYVEDRVFRYREMYLAHLRDSVQHCVDHVDFLPVLRKKSIV